MYLSSMIFSSRDESKFDRDENSNGVRKLSKSNKSSGEESGCEKLCILLS